MDKDTQITFAVIGGLVLFLAGLAYFLRESINISDITTTEVPVKQITAKPTPTKTPTKVTTASTTNATSTSTTTKATTTMEIPEKITSATITTNKGVIEVTFGTDTPATVANFAKLAKSGFYNGTRFHRVIKDFMIQGGDPLSKDINQKGVWGTGGPGYRFPDELTGKETYSQGTLAMANAGPNTNGSQFFIVTANPSVALPPSYTVFGKVTKGLDVALVIQDVKTDPNDRPLEDVIVEKVEVR